MNKKRKCKNGVDRMYLKCDCIAGSFVNGITQKVFYSFASDKPNGYELSEKRRSKHFKKHHYH